MMSAISVSVSRLSNGGIGLVAYTVSPIFWSCSPFEDRVDLICRIGIQHGGIALERRERPRQTHARRLMTSRTVGGEQRSAFGRIEMIGARRRRRRKRSMHRGR